MRRLIVLLAAAVIVAAACSSDDGGTEIAEDASTTSTEAPEPDPDGEEPTPDEGESDGEEMDEPEPEEEIPTGPSPGVTDDAIKIGITYVDLEPVRDFVDLDHGDYEGSYEAVIDDINANGGVNGRMLDPVYAAVNPIGSANADETCVRMAQDEDVFAVIGFHFGDTVLCYVEIEQRAVIGGAMTPERLARANAPWFTYEPGSDLNLDALAAFAEGGLFDGPFAVFGTILEVPLFDASLAELDALGLDPVDSAILDAPADDLTAQISQTQLIIESFRSAGAETVLLVGSAPVSWANGAETTDYRPRLLMTDAGTAEAVAGDAAERDLSVLSGAVLAGLFGPAELAYKEPNVKDCLEVIEASGIEVTDPAELTDDDDTAPHVAAFAACRSMALFTAIAEAAGDDLNYGSFRHAGENLGEMTMPGYPDPWVYGPPPSSDGDPAIYLFEFDEDELAFVRAS